MDTPASRACGIHAARLNLADYAVNFGDAHPPLTRAQALIEAERCYYCHDAPCATACPTGIDIPSFIHRIAQAMNNVSGKILVVGYSDNVPIRSARFASNYELSLERARSVQKMLQGSLSQPGRVKAEGRGEINPVAPNTTPENRARNRRVEITLLVSPENTQAELNGLPQGN